MLQILKNIKGFSLVEAMISVGLLSGVGLMIAYQAQNSSKVSTKMTLDQEINSIASRIQGVLSQRHHCTATIKDEVYGSLSGIYLGIIDTTNEPGSKFNLESERTRREAVLYKPGPIPKSRISIKEIKLLRKRDSQTDKVIGDFIGVWFTTGNTSTYRDFLIKAERNSTAFTGCESELSNEIYEGIAQACRGMGGSYDESEKKCLLTNLPQCFVTEADGCVTTGPGDDRQYMNAGSVNFSEFDRMECRTTYTRAFNPYKCHIANIDTSTEIRSCPDYGCSILAPHKSCTVRKLESYPCTTKLKEKTLTKCCRGGQE